MIGGVVALGAAADMMADLNSGAVDQLPRSRLGVDPGVTAPALQAWHISGSAFGVAGSALLFLLGLAVAGIGTGPCPARWPGQGWSRPHRPVRAAPVGFFASLAFLLWMAVEASPSRSGRRGGPRWVT